MNVLDLLKAALLGLVEGITEWLPISSTGHMILVDEFVKLSVSEEFWNMFLVVIQLGAILSVCVLYFHDLNPLSGRKSPKERKATWTLWGKIVVGCLPAAAAETDGDFGAITSVDDISWKTAFGIGCFQVLSLVPGTSRSGSTIIGGLLLGTTRSVAARFTFFLAIPVMFGASLLKIVKFLLGGAAMGANEWGVMIVGLVVAFVTSLLAIRWLTSFVRRHDFKVFGWYRIVLGVLVLAYFLVLA